MASSGRSAAFTFLSAEPRSGTTVHGKNSSTARSRYCEAKSLSTSIPVADDRGRVAHRLPDSGASADPGDRDDAWLSPHGRQADEISGGAKPSTVRCASEKLVFIALLHLVSGR